MASFRGQTLPPWRSPPDTIGRLFAGRYRVLHKVADGENGAVLRAEDIGTRESVAFKLLRPEVSAEDGLAPALQSRIRDNLELSVREPGALAGFVDVIDIGKTAEGLMFLIMPFVGGDDLESLLGRSGALPWSQAGGLFLRMTRQLERYHRLGRVHGYLQSRKCLLAEDGSVTFLDDGVDAFLHNSGGPTTARYASPEQANGEEPSAAADLYSLGVIFYELLTARAPFEDSSPNRTLAMHMLSPVPGLREVAPHAGISADVEAVILRALEKRPEDRFASMTELAAAIDGCRSTAGVTVPIAVPVEESAVVPVVAVRRAKVHEIERLLDPPDAALAEPLASAPDVRVIAGEPAGSAEPTLSLPFLQVASAKEMVARAPVVGPPPSLGAPEAPVPEGARRLGTPSFAAPGFAASSGEVPSAGAASSDGASGEVPSLAAPTLASPARPPEVAESTNQTERGGARPLAEPTLIGLVLPSLVHPEALASKSTSVAAAVAASLRGLGASSASATPEGEPAADPQEEGGEPSASSSSSRAVIGSSTSGVRRASRSSASGSMRRVIDLHPSASGTGSFSDDQHHPSSSGSMRMGAAASAGASGSRRIVNLVAVRAPGETLTSGVLPSESTSRGVEGGDVGAGAPVEAASFGLEGGAAASGADLLGSEDRFTAGQSTIQASYSDDDTLAESGIRPGPSRRAVSWALGGIGALVAGSIALAVLSPAAEAPDEPAPREETIVAPAVVPVAVEEPEAEAEVEAPPEEVAVAEPTPKKRRRGKGKKSKKSKKSKGKKSKGKSGPAATPEEEDDVLTQVQAYMREKKEREAKQADAVARSKANAKPTVSPADLAAAKERLSGARKAYKAGKFSAAYSLASQSLALNKSADALEMMGLASCARGDGDRARQVHDKLAASRRGALEARCRDSGITL